MIFNRNESSQENCRADRLNNMQFHPPYQFAQRHALTMQSSSRNIGESIEEKRKEIHAPENESWKHPL